MADSLVVARAIHFAATATVTGAALFRCLIADLPNLKDLRRPLAVLQLAGLALAFVSGVFWLLSVAAAFASGDMLAAAHNGAAWLLLTETNFGRAWLARLLLAVLVLVGLRIRSPILAAVAATWLMGALAWSGHAAGTPGLDGELHLLADVAHLMAAAAWLGSLLPLWLLYRTALLRESPSLWRGLQTATQRFSMLGVVCVGTLLATGVVNAWMLVASVSALGDTRYGELLVIKVLLFAAMVGVAAVNRLRLTPRLPTGRTARSLARNIVLELGLGLAILVIVSALGVLPPAGHAGMH